MSDVVRDLTRAAEAARTLLLNIRDIVVEDEQAKADAVEGQTDLFEVADFACVRIGQLEEIAETLKARRKKIDARIDRVEAQVDLIRTALAAAMSAAELKKMELPEATISRKPLPPKLIVLDEAQIPSQFWKRGDPKLDRVAVTTALRQNLGIPGATLSNGSETIAIRWG